MRHTRVAILLLLLLSIATAVDFPFYFDVGGRGMASVDMDKIRAAVPRVRFGDVFECPHPCGLLPCINAQGAVTNGGIPQLANMTLHLSTLQHTFDAFVPLNKSGLIDLDFECWNPLWDRTPAMFRNASTALVRKQHPSWTNETRIEAEARAQYEPAALTLLLETIAFVRKIRPHLTITMYGRPDRYYYNGYNSSNGPELRAGNDMLFPLWCKLDVLAPSVYQFYDSSHSPERKHANEVYVWSNVHEAVRLSMEVPQRCSSPAPPVWAYTWHYYHGTTMFLSDQDEAMYWEQTEAAGGEAMIMWGSQPTEALGKSFQEWYLADFAPLANGFTRM